MTLKVLAALGWVTRDQAPTVHLEERWPGGQCPQAQGDPSPSPSSPHWVREHLRRPHAAIEASRSELPSAQAELPGDRL